MHKQMRGGIIPPRITLLYWIHRFLKSGGICVNSTDESLYIGNSKGEPVQLLTSSNISDYLPNTTPLIVPRKSEIIVGNTVIFANKPWIVVNATSSQAILMCAHLGGSTSANGLSSYVNTWKAANITEEADYYLTGNKIFAPSENDLESYQYYNVMGRNSGYGCGAEWLTFASGWGSSDKEYVNADGTFGGSNGGDSATTSSGYRPFIVLNVTKLPTK